MVLDPIERNRTKGFYISKKELDERLTIAHFQKLQKTLKDGLINIENVIDVFKNVVQEQEKLLIL